MTAGVGVSEGTHDGVPGFSVGVAAEEDEAVGERAAGVVVIPKGDVFAKVDVGGGGIFDEGTVGGPVAPDVVGIWEVGDSEDVVPDNAATSVDEDSLGTNWLRDMSAWSRERTHQEGSQAHCSFQKHCENF